jgi:ACS family hexuronate transporter-like MFS transporter
LTWSWPWAFILTGAIGFLWLAIWWWAYRPPESHASLSKAEFAYIRSDPAEAITPVPWLKLLGYRQTWAFALGKFMTDPIWWFYLYWLGKFLNERHGLSLSKLGPPLIAIYLIADVGSVGGGWLSSFLIKRSWSINAARKTTMLVCALCVMPIVFATQVASLWAAVGLIGLAAAAHQGWSANIFTLASDMFPRRAVGSVVGIGGFAGAVGGMLIATAVGHLLQWTGSYLPVFLLAGASYLLALLVIQVLAPRLTPPNLDEA